MSPEEFLIDAYLQNLDAMKGQIKARYTELNGGEPTTSELQQQCWDLWRLTTFYIEAVGYMNRDAAESEAGSGRATYVPRSFSASGPSGFRPWTRAPRQAPHHQPNHRELQERFTRLHLAFVLAQAALPTHPPQG